MDFAVLSASDQLIHGRLHLLAMNVVCFISIVYAEHTFVTRRLLWSALESLSISLVDSPWLVAGDFNAIKDPSDRVGSSNMWIPAFDEFSHCMARSGLDDLRYSGCRFTWSTFSGALHKQRKIDRVLINDQ